MEIEIYCKYWQFFVVVYGSELLAQSDGEPVENLSHGHETDSKAKSTDAPKARDEIQPGHLWRPFKFWNNKVQVLLVRIKRRHGKNMSICKSEQSSVD